MTRIVASQMLQQARVQAVGSGNMKTRDSQPIIDEWASIARGSEPASARRRSTKQEIEAFVMGAGVRKEVVKSGK